MASGFRSSLAGGGSAWFLLSSLAAIIGTAAVMFERSSLYAAVVDAPLGYIYDRLGMYGPVEIRRFKRLPQQNTED